MDKIIETCAECGNSFEQNYRGQLEDMCDPCVNDLNERVQRMSDRDYRMKVTRAAVAWRDEFHHPSRQREADYRAFFASVMPEKPQHEVEEFIRKHAK